MTPEFRTAIENHSRSLMDLQASKDAIRSALTDWVATDGLQAVSTELGFSKAFICMVVSGRRAWGDFHWREK